MKGTTSAKPLAVGLSRALPTPINIGSDAARKNPTMIAPTITPGMDPTVPNTITANAGNRSESPNSGLMGRIAAINDPPKPAIPADKNAVLPCIRSRWIPLDAARSGLSPTALICFPSRVRCNRINNRIMDPNTPTISATLEYAKPYGLTVSANLIIGKLTRSPKCNCNRSVGTSNTDVVSLQSRSGINLKVLALNRMNKRALIIIETPSEAIIITCTVALLTLSRRYTNLSIIKPIVPVIIKAQIPAQINNSHCKIPSLGELDIWKNMSDHITVRATYEPTSIISAWAKFAKPCTLYVSVRPVAMIK